jgi:Mlc titration factor MtfA (ptsG expression regulator)
MYGALLIVIGGGLAAAWGIYLGVGYARRRRRAAWRAEPLPPACAAILARNVTVYSRLPAGLREVLHGHVNVFLRDKQFIGCAGLAVTDEMRLTIAGNACLLLLDQPEATFEGFSTVLVYPDTFVTREEEYDGEIVTVSDEARAGESWHGGPVVLAWADILDGLAHPGEGFNVVLHEFAHKLDEENGLAEGVPLLRDADDYARWAQVLAQEFESLAAGGHHEPLLDDYGAESPAEFFAVATETFFECGGRMQQRMPDLYAQLRKLYGVDPAAWT